MQSHSRQSYALPSAGTLIADEVQRLLRDPLLKLCVLVLGMMLLMVAIALSLGVWWDSLWSAG